MKQQTKDATPSPSIPVKEGEVLDNRLLNCINAIGARLDGEWDNPHLVKVGDLHSSIKEDIKSIMKFYLP